MNTRQIRTSAFTLPAALLAIAAVTAPVFGQGAGGGAAPSPPTVESVARSSGNPARDTLLKLQRPVTVDLTETRLEDVFKFIAEVTGAEMEVLWTSDIERAGFERDMLVTQSSKGLPAIVFIEKVMERMEGGLDENGWQMNEEGDLQIGPKARLNKFMRTEIYDINDLLFVIPDHADAPAIDLEQVLQQSEGGGGGGSPFDDEGDDEDDEERKTKEERAKDVIDLILALVENPQWSENGGEGGQIRYYQGTLIIKAADYMHRGVGGYRWWPSRGSAVAPARRYVGLDADTSVAKVETPIRTFPVTGAAGGGGGR